LLPRLFSSSAHDSVCAWAANTAAPSPTSLSISDEHRGYYTGWLQTSPTLGIVLSLIVIIATRTYLGEAAFNDWGWRIPFLFSFLLMLIAYYIHVHFQESPIFEEIKAKAGMTKNPWKEAFLSSNIKFVLIATIVVLGQGVVWYSSQFWALYFLQQVTKLDALTTTYIVGAGLVIGTPTLIFFGWLSDHIGRKPVILGGFLLAAVTYYPLYSWLGSVTQPGDVNYAIAIIIIAIRHLCGMVYGPIERSAKYFPGRIRHVGVRALSHRQRWGAGWCHYHDCGTRRRAVSATLSSTRSPFLRYFCAGRVLIETNKMSIWMSGKQLA
jgi:MFS family permease